MSNEGVDSKLDGVGGLHGVHQSVSSADSHVLERLADVSAFQSQSRSNLEVII